MFNIGRMQLLRHNNTWLQFNCIFEYFLMCTFLGQLACQPALTPSKEHKIEREYEWEAFVRIGDKLTIKLNSQPHTYVILAYAVEWSKNNKKVAKNCSGIIAWTPPSVVCCCWPARIVVAAAVVDRHFITRVTRAQLGYACCCTVNMWILSQILNFIEAAKCFFKLLLFTLQDSVGAYIYSSLPLIETQVFLNLQWAI